MLLPPQFIDSLQGLPGFNEVEFIRAHQTYKPTTAIRLNSEKKCDAGKHFSEYTCTPVPWCAGGYYLHQRPDFFLDTYWHGGHYYVQEPSSMFLWHILCQIFPNKQVPVTVLDLCAAPGGKSTLLIDYFRKGFIVANETIKSRTPVLVENIARWGASNVLVTQNDPAHFSNISAFFDLIVIDAPCSGSGLFRKDPNAIKHWRMEGVVMCHRRQKRIIADVWNSLKKDGYAIYATCSFSPEENEQIVDDIIEHYDVDSVKIPCIHEWQVVESLSPIHQGYGYRFYPHRCLGEGFFIAVFKKNTVQKQAISVLSIKHKKNNLTHGGNNPFVKESQDVGIINVAGTDVLFLSGWENQLQMLLKSSLCIKKVGIQIGSWKQDDFNPTHDLALSTMVHEQILRINVSKAQAIQFLRKEGFVVDQKYPQGFALMMHETVQLGWGKVLANRVNNYLPTSYRIVSRAR
ncbi:MAG: hypothetical protein QM528_07410 [Phycisphaerales bacterium]|nr:hypothetical protein [Phycisphaerales bacterium]